MHSFYPIIKSKHDTISCINTSLSQTGEKEVGWGLLLPYQTNSLQTEQKVGWPKKMALNSWFLISWTLGCLTAPRRRVRVVSPSSVMTLTDALHETGAIHSNNLLVILLSICYTFTQTLTMHTFEICLFLKGDLGSEIRGCQRGSKKEAAEYRGCSEPALARINVFITFGSL